MYSREGESPGPVDGNWDHAACELKNIWRMSAEYGVQFIDEGENDENEGGIVD